MIRRAALMLAGVILVAAAAAPLINATRFQQQIREGLERALQRKVEITGRVRFTVFSGPGFTAEDVLIAEDPRAGIEPFAYVAALSSRIRLRSLWTGKLEFSTLTLEEPSVNLVKIPGGPWNIQPFLQRAASANGGGAAEALPDLRVRGGRLNFKFGDTKSVFYLANADVDVRALSDEGDSYSVAFTGEPARTDRAAQSFGRLSGRGRWFRGANQENMLSMSAKWEKSNISEFLLLWFGRDSGVHGLIAADARFEGPLRDLKITGRMQIDDIHRWDLLPARGEGWPVPFEGRLNFGDGSLTVETTPDARRRVDARFKLSGLTGAPRYGFLVTLRELPVAPLLDVAKHLGALIPPKMESAGFLSGAIGYSAGSGLQGGFVVSDLSLNAPAATLAAQRLTAVTDGDGVSLKAPRLQVGRKEDVMSVEAGYSFSTSQLEVRITTAGVEASAIRTTLLGIAGLPPAPFFERLRKGRLKGKLHYSAGGKKPGSWIGTIEVAGGAVEIPGVAETVILDSAMLHFDGARLEASRMKARAGNMAFQGAYSYEPQAPRPHRFDLQFPAIDALELERLFAPALMRRRGLIARTLRLSSPPPDWLKFRRAEGVLEIGSLSGPEWEARSIEARLTWDGTQVRLRDLIARWEGGAVRGSLLVDLSRGVPAYHWTGALKGAAWRGGEVDADVELRSAGNGAEILGNLAGKGCFQARNVALAADAEFISLSGCFVAPPSGPNRLEIAKLEGITAEQEGIAGKAVVRRNGAITLEMTDAAKRPLRLSGVFSPWKMEIVP